MNPPLPDEEETPLPAFKLRREGRNWIELTPEEFEERMHWLRDFRCEILDGIVGGDEDVRLAVLGILLENAGLDAAVRLGDPNQWRAAIEALE